MADAIASVGEIDRAACRAAVEGYFSVERMVRRAPRAVRGRHRRPGQRPVRSGERRARPAATAVPAATAAASGDAGGSTRQS